MPGEDQPQWGQYAVAGPYDTALSTQDEQKFQQWIKTNKVPWKDSPTSDYDMRGYWKAQQAGDPTAKQAANLHYPDTWKTPYHETFSNESKYAKPNAGHWEGEKFVPPTNDTLTLDPDQLKAARAAGYTDEEILDHVAKSKGQDFKKATDAGYSAAEILQHLSNPMTENQTAPPTTGANNPAQRRLKQAQPGITPAQRAVDPTNQAVVAELKNAPAQAVGATAPELLPEIGGAGLGGKILTGVAKGTFGSGVTQAGENVVSGKPITKNVASAALQGALLGGTTSGLSSALETRAVGKAAQAATEENKAFDAAKAVTAAKTAADEEAKIKTAASGIKQAASTVAELTSKASDEAVTLNPNKSLGAFVSKLPKAEADEFLDKVQPRIEEAGQAITKNLIKASPREALQYRDAVMDALKGPEYDNYRKPIYDAITSDLDNSLKAAVTDKKVKFTQAEYDAFKKAVDKIPHTSSTLTLASKVGTAADEAAYAAAGGKKAVAKANPVPTNAAVPSASDPSFKEAAKTAVKKFAKEHPYITAAGAGMLGTSGLPLAKKAANFIFSKL